MIEPTTRTLLVIDDEAQVRMLFRTALEAAGYRVMTAENGQHALNVLMHQDVDLILVDIFMPGMDGLELIPRLRATKPSCRIVAMSGGTGEWNAFDLAKDLGAHHTLKKPFSPRELIEAISAQLLPSEVK
ncbi:response regulator [Nitrospira sp. NS4]|uniref:response regulator n=1 Tax=Nitrospira sp. NS4 TaxID=3414498 RepID=UPI003C2FF5B4